MSECVLRGRDYRDGHTIELSASNGIISAIRPLPADHGLPLIAPGLVDLQVNGYAGIDFNQPELVPDALAAVTRRLWQDGVTAYLPTVITNSDANIQQMMARIDQQCRTSRAAAQGVAGVHLEGPFIASEDGPRGAHDRQFTRAPDWASLQQWQQAAAGRIKLLTLAPEWPGSSAFIRQCCASGITVSLGHTAANSAQIAQAVAAGASLSTHLGNGAHLMLPRHPNYIWDQLAEDRLGCAMIADGDHLPLSVLKVFIRVKQAQALLVSDATCLTGMPAGRYQLHIGGEVDLSPQGRLSLASNPQLLAGSARSLLHGVNTLRVNQLTTRQQAWEMASLRPAAKIGLAASRGLAIGAPLDVVLLAEQPAGELQVLSTWKAGQCVWRTD